MIMKYILCPQHYTKKLFVETETVNLLNETDGSNEDVNEESVFEQTKVARKRKSLKVMETEQ